MLRGDEVGALLGDHLLRKGKQGIYAASIVSSSLLGKLTRAAGQPYVDTLTGFKWIGRLERSEEPTSELQSLMRIALAVFCLKTQIHAPHSASNTYSWQHTRTPNYTRM